MSHFWLHTGELMLDNYACAVATSQVKKNPEKKVTVIFAYFSYAETINDLPVCVFRLEASILV